ncbi:MAG: retroviral-like aspartic protease family protein [Actinomycetota bacterium]|nr:retroviral-like aspartic protease family protein [Actinomycetota bacterium]
MTTARSHPRRFPARRGWIAIATATAAVVVLAGCGIVVGGGSLSKAPEEVGEGQVGLEVFSDPTGSTLLLVPVSFGEAGPYQFVLDTGASRTLVDSGLAQELRLSQGPPAQGYGLGAQFQGATVEVQAWRVGDIELQPRTIVAAELPDSPPQGPQFRGLLGSDVLAGFGVVEIDYEQQILTLRRPQ